MAQETFTITIPSQGISTSVTINDTSSVSFVDFIGTYQDLAATWTVPSGVTTISAVCIGGGGGGGATSQGGTYAGGGGGGGLSWANNIAVTPGETLYIQAGRYGQPYSVRSDPPGDLGSGGAGGNSLIYRNTGSIVYVLDANGGVGGRQDGGVANGGAGGPLFYPTRADGGERGAASASGTAVSSNGFTVRGGGSAGTYNSTATTVSGGGGLGRALTGVQGDSSEDSGIADSQYPERGETYGGGGSGSRNSGFRGAPGAVRITWGTTYPSGT
jgi:hypothetical protein